MLFNIKKDSQIEIEALGFIDEKEFINLKKTYSIKYRNPERKNRLAISIWNPRVNKNTDTRIRITNGKAKIMQKNGDWENRVDMKLEELSIKLKNFVDDILSAYKILMNIIKSDYAARIIQHESYIFYTKSCEIKLIKQFGKEDKYLFEVELSDNSDDLEELLNQLDLLKYIRKTDVSFWNKWNEDVNLTSSDLSEQELKKLIQTYLDIN